MFIKKTTTFVLLGSQLLALIGAFVLLHPLNATIAISDDQENIQSEDLSEQEQQEVIVTGNASFGTNPVTGRVRIITNRKQLSTVIEGDIVVASAINSFWYSGLSVASALITEKNDNSALALGKKLNIPVIIGASGAMKKMTENEVITCDPLSRNIYHVSFSTPCDVHFDRLIVSHKEDNQNLYQKLGKEGKAYQLPISEKTGNAEEMDRLAPQKARKISTLQSGLAYKPKRITQNVYRSHFNKFKAFALGIKSQYGWGKWTGTLKIGAKATGRDPFTIDCMEIGDVLLGNKDDEYFVKVLERIGTEEYIQYMDLLVDRCGKKPSGISEANWIARVSHQEHVKAVDIPAEVDKEKLMEHPKEYKKIENKVSKEEREARIAAGLFALYWMEKKLPL